MRYLIADVSTAPIDGCEEWLEPSKAPSTWKDPKKIADHIAEKDAEKRERAGLDPDLSRVTGLGWFDSITGTRGVELCKTEQDERDCLQKFATSMRSAALIGFNSLRFDWPFLVRRGMYLGISLHINTDRFKSNHVDLSELLTHRGLLTPKSLSFYVRRLHWSDLAKPLSGAEESQVPVTGRWAELEQSIHHDIEATRRLARWMNILTDDAPVLPVDVMSTEQIF